MVQTNRSQPANLIEYPQPGCDQSCIATIKRTATIVTGLDESLRVNTGERAILGLFKVLHRRAGRLVHDRTTRRRLNPLLRKFVCNLVMYFKSEGKLDNFMLTNIITALSLADNHGEAEHGTMDYSTLIRRPNPAHPDSDDYFVIGREGRTDDPECPMRRFEARPAEIARVPREQLSVFYGFYHARQQDPARGAPRIRVEDFGELVPPEIRIDPVLEEAFTDVCLSDGAWELYQRKIAA
ncbi:MAG: hypothetical protein JSW64_08275 [Candidatus Zixiibacteriota bacterium]|nr:MAG: hypothetical protein JSW64_08275 [candidate division Zixibacteria bacterium]